MKTVTFNPAIHAILPIEPTKAMLDGHFSVLDIEADDVYSHQYELATACFKAMIAAAPEYPADAGWISVDERLPDDGADFIGYLFYKKRPHDKQIRVCRFLPSEHVEVTHWMPLPPVPEVV